jgi:hypothetical protein
MTSAFVCTHVHFLTLYTIMAKHALAKVPPFWQKLAQASAPGITYFGYLVRSHSLDPCLRNAPTVDPSYAPPVRGISLASPYDAIGLDLVTQE